MQISKLGEFGLIDRIRKSIKTDTSVIVGSGDDCAVLEFDKKSYQLFTCDMLVEGVDFLKGTDFYWVGRKAVCVSISDIASCCGVPQHCVISLGLPKDLSLDKVDRLTKGIIAACKEYGVNLVGGDISKSQKVVIDVSMIGRVEKNSLVLRSAARDKDIIFTTGSLGGSIKGKHLKFIPRLKEARFLAENFKVHSMIDISDGLLQDLGHILKQSKKGAVLYQDLVPVSSQAKDFKASLTDGEDFELLFTVDSDCAKKLMRQDKFCFYPIGEINCLKERIKLILNNQDEKNIQPQGYRHF
ncbi:MAG: thiamine-phosphate kinase [Candidatus Omnitrophica bacterium]|jgi:thiamine-monophosphate kinase|nr:thiamine-phosphate kinase [Candidatus Omnitrophota bacterium]